MGRPWVDEGRGYPDIAHRPPTRRPNIDGNPWTIQGYHINAKTKRNFKLLRRLVNDGLWATRGRPVVVP